MPDLDGDIIKLDGMEITNKPYILLKNFDKAIGMCNVKREGNVLYADLEFLDSEKDKYDNTFPSIGFQIVASSRDGDSLRITKSILRHVSLSTNPNINHDILSVGEQLKTKGT